MVCWDFRVPKLPVVDRVLLKTFRHVFEAGTVTAVSLINAFSFGITFASLLAAAGSGYDLRAGFCCALTSAIMMMSMAVKIASNI